MPLFRRSAGYNRLNPPKHITFAISLILVLVAVASLYIRLPGIGSVIAPHRFWIAVAGYVLLALGCILRGL